MRDFWPHERLWAFQNPSRNSWDGRHRLPRNMTDEKKDNHQLKANSLGKEKKMTFNKSLE